MGQDSAGLMVELEIHHLTQIRLIAQRFGKGIAVEIISRNVCGEQKDSQDPFLHHHRYRPGD